MSAKLLVTGASGQLGQGVIKHLVEDQKVPGQNIIAVTRNPSGLADLASRGIEVREGDLSDERVAGESICRRRPRAHHLHRYGAGQRQRLRQHTAAVAAAKTAGASRVLYTSMPKPDVSVISFAFEHLGSEKAVKESGLPYTIFRNGWYQENLFMSLPQALKSGQWFTSAGDGRVAYAARDDFAAAIAGGLASDETGNRIHTLTGPEALSAAQVAELASGILGKPISVAQVTDEQLAAGLRQHGLPELVVDMIVSIDANTRGGFLEPVTGDMEAFLDASRRRWRASWKPTRRRCWHSGPGPPAL